MTTKILALTDALGNLVRFVLLPGHRFDTVGVEPLIEGLSFDALIADKAFDSNSIIADLNERGAKIVISQHPRRAKPLNIDAEIYKWRREVVVIVLHGKALNSLGSSEGPPCSAKPQSPWHYPRPVALLRESTSAHLRMTGLAADYDKGNMFASILISSFCDFMYKYKWVTITVMLNDRLREHLGTLC